MDASTDCTQLLAFDLIYNQVVKTAYLDRLYYERVKMNEDLFENLGLL